LGKNISAFAIACKVLVRRSPRPSKTSKPSAGSRAPRPAWRRPPLRGGRLALARRRQPPALALHRRDSWTPASEATIVCAYSTP